MSREGSPGQPRRFAPLSPTYLGNECDARPKLRGVVFDVDGTLCEPQNYMFGEMRAALGIEKPTDILDHIYTLSEAEQENAMEKIRDIERKAMRIQKPQVGLVELMDYLDARGIRKGICTRNFDTPVSHLLTTFLPAHSFHPIVTRDFRPPKPSPAGILHIAKSWDLTNALAPSASATSATSPDVEAEGDGSQLIMVGDSVDDMTAGHLAGAATVLLANEANLHLAEHQHTDLVVRRLDELIAVLEEGFVGQIPKGDESPDTRKQVEDALKRT